MALEIPFVDDAHVKARWQELYRLFYDFRDEYEKQVADVEINIDETKLFLTTIAYFHDVARYKWWHYRTQEGGPENAHLQSTKRAAFLCYWLNRLSPLYVVRSDGADFAASPSEISGDISVMVNVHFAVHVAMFYLGFVLSEDLTAKLVYHLLWREGSARTYILLFETLEEIRQGRSIFVTRSLEDYSPQS